MPVDQRLVFLTEVQPKASPNSFGTVRAYATLDEPRGKRAPAERQRDRDLGPERQHVLAAQVAMTDIRVPIVLFEIDLIEEPRLDVEGLEQRPGLRDDRIGARIAEFVVREER